MTIIAQSADNTQHEFPDGTPAAVIDKAMKDYASGKQPPSTLVDMARSIPGGLAKGAAAIAGIPGDVDRLGNAAIHGVFGAFGADEKANDLARDFGNKYIAPHGSGDIADAISKPTGGFYEPQTTAGRFAETAAEFAPAAIGGEASIPARALGRVLAPAAGSQLAGSEVSEADHPIIHGAAQIGGALLGGGLAAGARSLGGALLEDQAPEVTASKHLAKILQGQNVTPEDITQKAIPGRGQLGAEALGPNGVAMLATLGRRSGTTGEALASALTTRSVAAPSRMMDDFTAAAGIDPRAAQGNFDQVLEAGQKRAEPLYKEAYKQNTNIASPVLDKILETPAGKKALADARVKMQNDMSLMGTPDADLMEQAAEGGTELPAKGASSGMKLRVYDYVKRSLDDQISTAYRAGNKNEGNIIRDLKTKLVGALDDADVTAKAGPNSVKPEGGAYAQARAAAGDYLGAQKAYEDGQSHILSTSVSADDVAKYAAKLSPTAQEAYKGGIANKILTQAQNGRLTPRLLGTPAVKLKLAAAIGPDKAEQFIQSVQHEAELAKTGARMMPGTGSITSDVLMNAGEQDGATMLDAGISGAKALGHTLQGNFLSGAGHGISTFRKIGDLHRSASMRPEVRNELGRLLMLSPEDLAMHAKNLPTIIAGKQKTLGQLLMGSR